MKLGIIGTGNVGCAIALAAVTRGSARNRAGQSHQQDGRSRSNRLRYDTPLGPKVDIRHGDYGGSLVPAWC